MELSSIPVEGGRPPCSLRCCLTGDCTGAEATTGGGGANTLSTTGSAIGGGGGILSFARRRASSRFSMALSSRGADIAEDIAGGANDAGMVGGGDTSTS